MENINVNNLMPIPLYKVETLRNLTETAYIIRIEKKNFRFIPGQYLSLGIENSNQTREYSIYSSVNDPYIEILIKEIEDGFLSKKIRKCNAGDYLKIDGPFGFFTIEPGMLNKKFLFVATGTGISPFHSLVASYPELDYQLLHGVRFADEAYEHSFYKKERYVLCTTRDDKGNFKGRVTEYLKKNPVNKQTLVYLCGNHKMIYDVYDILTKQNFPLQNIKTEVYF